MPSGLAPHPTAPPSANIDGDDISKAPPAGGLEDQTNGLAHLDLEPATLAVHADDRLNVIQDVAPPIHVSTTYRYPKDPSRLKPFHEPHSDRDEQHIYSRDTTANTTRLEAILTTLLKVPCITYSSGLSSFHGLLTFLNPKAIAIGNGYHGCHGVLKLHQRLTGAKQLPLDCNPSDLNAGDLLWLETPVNPFGEAFNIQHYADIAHSRGAYLGVDSTFAPPPLQDPFRWGADVVMHSGTKYISGHSDMLCGVLAVKRKEWLPKLIEDRLFLGSVMGGLEGWLGVRSLRTLELRVMRASENAGRIVEALDGALTGRTVGTGLSEGDVEAVKAVLGKVRHASLQQSGDVKWLRRQMPNGYGPVFSIIMKEAEAAKRLPSKLHLFHHATSLGGVESLIEWRTMTDNTVEKTLLRVSVGVEDARDLLDDLLGGFRALAEEAKRLYIAPIPGQLLLRKKFQGYATDLIQTLLLLLCLPCLCGLKLRKDLRSSQAAAKRRAEEDRARDAPEPLPLRRRRDVSTVREGNVDGCGLLTRLPREMRFKIWQYAMNSGGRHIHLMHGKGKVGHAMCGAGSHEEAGALRQSPCCESKPTRSCCPKTLVGVACLWNGGCVVKTMYVHSLYALHPDAELESHPRLDLTLLRVCRQMYNEAVELPYATNIFDVDDLITLVYWSQTILPSRLQLVRDLRVDWQIYWPPYTKMDPSGVRTSQTACPFDRIRLKHSNLVWWEFWLVVSRMTGLRDVRMTLGFLSGQFHYEDLRRLFGPDQGLVPDLDAAWLQPILNVRGLTNFELVIADGDCGEYYLGESEPRQPDPADEERRRQFLQKLSAYMTTEHPWRNVCGPGLSEEALRAKAQSY